MFDGNDLNKSNYVSRLQKAHNWIKGGDRPSYIDLRILEKQGLIYLYRDYKVEEEFEIEQGRVITRPRIKGGILMYRGRQLLGLEAQPKKPSLWELD